MLRGVQLTLRRRMSTALLESFQLTAGQTITCKAAVAWEPKKPLDVTDIQVFFPSSMHFLFLFPAYQSSTEYYKIISM
jgi:hypothetical protein